MSNVRRPDIETLKQGTEFRQIMELDFNDMIPFVISNIKKRSIFSLIYAGSVLLLLILIAVLIISGLADRTLFLSSIIKQSALGVLSGSILIIPVHELLHGLAYRILGAKKIRFGADMQQFIFYVTADRYPVSGKEIYFLALTPFVMVNLATVLVTLFWFPQVILFPAFLLVSHNIMCIGDFAISNYVSQYAGKKVYSYDEVKISKSYFFVQMNEGDQKVAGFEDQNEDVSS